MHVLIVDDDQLMRSLLMGMVEHAGHTHCHAANYEDAMRLLRREKPDAVLLDLNLGPHSQDGYSIVRDKDLDPDTRHVKVIIVSGRPPSEVRYGAQTIQNALAGTRLILTKPVSQTEIEKALAFLAAELDAEDDAPDTDPGA